MKFNRNTWLNWKVRKPCPACSVGTLVPMMETYKENETADSIDRNEGSSDYDSDYVFSSHLRCTSCPETVIVSGFKNIENYPQMGKDDVETVYYPKLFLPAPNIISIPESCSDRVKEILKQAFSLYWLDVSSCANKIRISVEVLLDDLKVIKTTIGKNNINVDLTLHQRIVEFQKVNAQVAEYLLSIKWIGNAGSHYSEITKENCLDGFEILEYTLEQLYNDRKNKIDALSTEINKRKKP